MILLTNPLEYEACVPQLGDRERIDPGAPGRTITGPIILAAGASIEITADEVQLFDGNSVFRLTNTGSSSAA